MEINPNTFYDCLTKASSQSNVILLSNKIIIKRKYINNIIRTYFPLNLFKDNGFKCESCAKQDTRCS